MRHGIDRPPRERPDNDLPLSRERRSSIASNQPTPTGPLVGCSGMLNRPIPEEYIDATGLPIRPVLGAQQPDRASDLIFALDRARRKPSLRQTGGVKPWYTHVGIGTVRTCPPVPIRSAITQCSSPCWIDSRLRANSSARRSNSPLGRAELLAETRAGLVLLGRQSTRRPTMLTGEFGRLHSVPGEFRSDD
jgi:hypothetical protein